MMLNEYHKQFVSTNFEGGNGDGFENKIVEYHPSAIKVFARKE
jgi:hypothetical protein